jgi:hypothetical protein
MYSKEVISLEISGEKRDKTEDVVVVVGKKER